MFEFLGISGIIINNNNKFEDNSPNAKNYNSSSQKSRQIYKYSCKIFYAVSIIYKMWQRR